MPDALAFIPVCLLNAGLPEPGAGTPPQGTNVNTPPKRLLAQGQGTGQHQGCCQPPPSCVGSLTHLRRSRAGHRIAYGKRFT